MIGLLEIHCTTYRIRFNQSALCRGSLLAFFVHRSKQTGTLLYMLIRIDSTSVADPQGGEGGDRPPRLGPKINFIARPKTHTHLQTRFCMPEFAKTHLQQSRISKFSRGEPSDPPIQGEGREGEGREETEGKEKGRREGKDREGRGGTGRVRGGKEGGRGGMGRGGEGRGGALDVVSAPSLETRSGSAPDMYAVFFTFCASALSLIR